MTTPPTHLFPYNPAHTCDIIDLTHFVPPNLERVVKDRKMLDSFDVDYIELETLMWQACASHWD